MNDYFTINGIYAHEAREALAFSSYLEAENGDRPTKCCDYHRVSRAFETVALIGEDANDWEYFLGLLSDVCDGSLTEILEAFESGDTDELYHLLGFYSARSCRRMFGASCYDASPAASNPTSLFARCALRLGLLVAR